MKMKSTDIGTTDKIVRKVLGLVPSSRPKDPVADMYRRIRDAAMFAEDVPCGLRVAALELVKAEIVQTMLAQLDES